MEPRNAYHLLCTEFYNISKPQACVDEIAFYASLLKDIQGPILEAMCGSGRLLIPLLRMGFQIEGVDNSDEMLEACKKRSAQEKLTSTLFNQSIENLHLKIKIILVHSFTKLTENLNGTLLFIKSHYHSLNREYREIGKLNRLSETEEAPHTIA